MDEDSDLRSPVSTVCPECLDSGVRRHGPLLILICDICGWESK